MVGIPHSQRGCKDPRGTKGPHFAMMPLGVITDPDLSAVAVRVFGYIAAHSRRVTVKDAAGESVKLWSPTALRLEIMAGELGSSRSSLRRAVVLLEERGYLRVGPRVGGRGRANRFDVTPAWETAERAATVDAALEAAGGEELTEQLSLTEATLAKGTTHDREEAERVPPMTPFRAERVPPMTSPSCQSDKSEQDKAVRDNGDGLSVPSFTQGEGTADGPTIGELEIREAFPEDWSGASVASISREFRDLSGEHWRMALRQFGLHCRETGYTPQNEVGAFRVWVREHIGDVREATSRAWQSRERVAVRQLARMRRGEEHERQREAAFVGVEL